MTVLTRKALAELAAVMANATPAPWAYKPQDNDDWGCIRSLADTEGERAVVAVSRSIGIQDNTEHRVNRTDPFEANGLAIVAIVNAYSDLVETIAAQAAQIERLKGCLLPIRIEMVKADMIDQPYPSDRIVASFERTPETDRCILPYRGDMRKSWVTAGDIRDAWRPIALGEMG